MEDKILKELSTQRVREMNQPVIVLNVDDFEVFKKNIESQIKNCKIENDIRFKGYPVTITFLIKRGEVFIYDFGVGDKIY